MTIIQEPLNTGNPPARQTPGIEPPTTVQPKPTDQIGNRVQIPDPVRTMPPDSGPSTTTTAQEPQNTNNRPALGRQSTEAPVIRRPVPTDQIGDRVLISRSVQTTPSSAKPPIHYNNTKPRNTNNLPARQTSATEPMLPGNPNPRTESRIVRRFSIQSVPRPQTPGHRPGRFPQNRRIPTLHQHTRQQPPYRQPQRNPNP